METGRVSQKEEETMVNIAQIEQQATNGTLSNHTWREHKTHRAESAAVKKALIEAGYTSVRVGHGSGTAWGWLKIHADPLPEQTWQEKDRAIVQIAQRVTGRHGDYDGRINVD